MYHKKWWRRTLLLEIIWLYGTFFWYSFLSLNSVCPNFKVGIQEFSFSRFWKLIILGLTWCIPCVTIAKGRSGEDSVSPTDSSMSSSSNSSKSDTTVINTVSKTQTTSKTVILNNGLSCKSLQRSGSLSSNCRSKLLVCSRIFWDFLCWIERYLHQFNWFKSILKEHFYL